MSRAVLEAFPDAEVVLLDGAGAMLAEARGALAESSISTVEADLRDPLPEGPFDAVVSRWPSTTSRTRTSACCSSASVAC